MTTPMDESPREVGTAQTLEFFRRFPVGDRPRVLEVGCGEGELAVHLQRGGWQVLGIDIDRSAVAAARARGVNAMEADLLTFVQEPFDVVLVTHSLHHISPLEDAVERLHRLVRPGGWLLAEEFDHAAFDPVSLSWFYERRDLLDAAGALQGTGPRPPLAHDPRGRAQHGHRESGHGHGHAHGGGHHGHSHGPDHLHTGARMREAIETRFKVHIAEEAPYLYRYLLADLRPTAQGHRLGGLMLEQERRAIAERQIQPIGLRIAAQRE